MKGGRGKKRFTVSQAAGRAGRAGPVGDSEDIFDLSGGFGLACEEAGKEGVGVGSEGVDGQGPTAQGGEAQGQVANVWAADRAGHLKGPVARVVVHAFED
jgi:hypothetical protein